MSVNAQEASRLSRDYHRLANQVTGESRASAMRVAIALDAAVIRWAESDGATPVDVTIVPTEALDELRKSDATALAGSTSGHRRLRAVETFLAAIDKAATS